MNKFTNSLDNVKIASPCSQDWNQMIGNDRRRFCGDCKLNVYNLSGMTRTEAENLLANSEGRLCVRFYRRADGSILTEDCPVGWAQVKRRVSKTAAAVASLLFGLLTSAGIMGLFSAPKQRFTMGAIAPQTSSINDSMGEVNNVTPLQTPEPLMGNLAIPAPPPKAKSTPKESENFELGRISKPLMGTPLVPKGKN